MALPCRSPTVVSIIGVEEHQEQRISSRKPDVATAKGTGGSSEADKEDEMRRTFFDEAPPEVRKFFLDAKLAELSSSAKADGPLAAPPGDGTVQEDSSDVTIVRRRIWLENSKGDVYGYAVSWWDGETYRKVMPDPSKPIGGSMAMAKLEIYREIHSAFACRPFDSQGATSEHTALLRGLGLMDDEGKQTRECKGSKACGEAGALCSCCTVWCRYYTMWHRGKPLSLVCEVFSPVGAGAYLGEP
jgi:p-hydroxybenzoic acid synthase